MAASNTRVPLIFGTMTIGDEGKNGVRIPSPSDQQSTLDIFFKHGGNELDTAFVYGEGSTEVSLSKLNLNGSSIDTKVYPTNGGEHEPAKLREIFETSLKKLNVKKVRTLYLHAPDRSVPFAETLTEADKLFKEGKFEQFGLSNFAAWEVAEVVNIARERNLVVPAIYQAMYNGITRAIEDELVPCLRKHGLRLVVYNPLAGGYLAGRITSPAQAVEKGSRFDDSSKMGAMYRERYLRDDYFTAVQALEPIAKQHNLLLTEIALRWVQHHSVLTEKDGVILGASSAEQLEQNCADSEKGPLPKEVVEAVDLAWKIVKPSCPLYWR